MISPSPTPVRTPAPASTEAPAHKEIQLVPEKQLPGQTPTALVLKTILRPILKTFYYIIRWIRGHKLVSLIAILLLLASIFVSTYVVTGFVPIFGPDQVEKQIDTTHMSSNIKAWLVALRNDDTTTMSTLEKNMAQAPDPTTLATSYSESQGHIQWTSIGNPIITAGADNLADTFIEVDLSGGTSSGATATFVSYWHFTTDKNGRILYIDTMSPRQAP